MKMFWVELWPILLKEFGEELVLNEILSVCTLVARDSTVDSAQSSRTACTAQYKATQCLHNQQTSAPRFSVQLLSFCFKPSDET